MKDNLNIIFVLALSIASVIASFIVSVISTKKNKHLPVKLSNHQDNNQLLLSDYTSIDNSENNDDNTKISNKDTTDFITWNLDNHETPIISTSGFLTSRAHSGSSRSESKHNPSSSRKKRKSLKRKKRHTKPWYDNVL